MFKNQKYLTISTIITLFRIIAAPLIVLTIFQGKWTLSFILFIIASFSDFLDGFIARKFNQQTILGSYLDPLADKILLTASFFALAFLQSTLFNIPKWFVFLILIKECILICGAIVALLKKNNLIIKPTFLGKFSTFIQILFILWVFASYFLGHLPIKSYYFLLTIISILVIITLLQYIKIGLKQFNIN